MEEVKDIILNVYTLSVPSNTTEPSSSPTAPPPNAAGTNSATTTTTGNNRVTTTSSGSTTGNSWTSFLVGKILPSVGMGAYHTSLRIGTSDSDPYTTTYTFVANQGIVQEKKRSRNNNNNNSTLPSHATFKEEIILGSCTCQRGEINEILQMLTQLYFTNTSYHLVHRNCNHFTETFATALIYYQDFMDQKNAMSNAITASSSNSSRGIRLRPKPPQQQRLSTYPDWINRLANTGANVISHDSDIIPCHPYHEAYHAVTKMTLDNSSTTTSPNASDNTDKASGRWGFTSVLPGSRTTTTGTATSSSTTTTSSKAKKNEKKELTEAQKKLLEKIRKK